MVKRAMLKLSPEKRRQFYDSCFNANSNQIVTFDVFNQSIEGEKSGAFIFLDTVFHVGADNAIRNLENVMTDEEIETSCNEMDNIIDPGMAEFPREKKEYRPYDERIEELKNGIAPNDPDADAKKAILDKAANNLVYIRNDYLNYLRSRRLSI